MLRRILLTIGLSLLYAPFASAGIPAGDINIPKPGEAAPDLVFDEILQAPKGARADWLSFHGKTVVLVFWATWCVPCVAEIPVLNALERSVDTAKVQFISIDFNGEDRKTVMTFLTKHPMAGWVGIDTSKEMQRRFKISAIPITVVIGPDGRVAHLTDHPETLKGEQLTAVADGKAVVFDDVVHADTKLLEEQKQLAAQAQKAKIESFLATNGKTIAEFSVPGNRAATITLSDTALVLDDGLPADVSRTAMWEPGRFDVLNARIQDLVENASGIPSTRIIVSGISSEKRYNLHVDMLGTDSRALERSIDQVITTGIGVRIKHEIFDRDVSILTAAAESPDHSDVANAPPPHYCIFIPGGNKTISCNSGSFDNLAQAVEEALGTPVLNEGKVTGSVTATIPVASPDLRSISETLGKNLGVALMPAKRPIEMLVVSPVH